MEDCSFLKYKIFTFHCKCQEKEAVLKFYKSNQKQEIHIAQEFLKFPFFTSTEINNNDQPALPNTKT